MIRFIFIFVGVLLSVSFVFAEDAPDGKALGKTLATERRGQLDTILGNADSSDDLLSTDKETQRIPGFGGSGADDVSQIGLDNDGLTNVDPDNDAPSEEAKKAIKGFKDAPDLTTTKYGTDFALGSTKKALETQDAPLDVESLNSLITSNYDSCVPYTSAKEGSKYEDFCDGWVSENSEICRIDRWVTAYANDFFRCEKSSPNKKALCREVLTKKCTREYPGQDVSDHIIVPELALLRGTRRNGHLEVVYADDGMSITIQRPDGDDPWYVEDRVTTSISTGLPRVTHRTLNCRGFGGTMTFDILDLDAVDSFVLNHLTYQDWLQVTINGELIYRGPRGGSYGDGSINYVYVSDPRCRTWCNSTNYHNIRLWLHSSNPRREEIGSSIEILGRCEQGRTRNIRLNLDLLPYLVEGENKLRFSGFYSRNGNFWAKFSGLFRRCGDFSENWTRVCVE